MQWAGNVTNRKNTAITVVLAGMLLASSTLLGLLLAAAMIVSGL
jgi:hypothetical protein